MQKPTRFNHRASWRALIGGHLPPAAARRRSRRMTGSGHACLPWPSAFSKSPHDSDQGLTCRRARPEHVAEQPLSHRHGFVRNHDFRARREAGVDGREVGRNPAAASGDGLMFRGPQIELQPPAVVGGPRLAPSSNVPTSVNTTLSRTASGTLLDRWPYRSAVTRGACVCTSSRSVNVTTSLSAAARSTELNNVNAAG